MNLKRLLPLLLFMVGLCGAASAQSWSVSGRVLAQTDGSPIVGATVISEQGGCVSDIKGYYELKVGKQDTISVSYLGYDEQRIFVDGRSSINVELVESAETLDEVVIIGYGQQRKREITGAISSVKSEDIEKFASSSFADALQGQMAGVNVQASSGAPGGKANIQIRGIGSFSSGALSPLYVVDGFPYSDMPDINPNDVESIEVLKDAASASIYGTRASNGVIMITTKRAKAGEMKVDYNGYYGIQSITSSLPLTSAEQYLYTYKMREIMNEPEGGQLANPLEKNAEGLDNNIDWVGLLFRENAAVQNHSVTLSGGDKNLTNTTMLNYFDQDGVIIKSKYKMFTGRTNTTYKRGKFTAFANIGLTYSYKDNAPWNMHSSAISLSPILKPVDFDAESGVVGSDSNAVGGMANAMKEENSGLTRGYSFNTTLSYEIVKGLTASVNAGGNVSDYKGRVFEPQFLLYDEEGNLLSTGTQVSKLSEVRTYTERWSSEFLLKYNKQFNGGHKLDLLAGYSLEGFSYESRKSVKTEFPSSGDITVPDAGTSGDQFTGTDNNSALIGMMARAMYNYKDRYMVSASVRRDGSSKFGANKWATFPSASVGWTLSQEPFYKGWYGLNRVLNNVKFRASIGTAGNQNITNYSYSEYIVTNLNYVLGTEGNDDVWYGAAQRAFANDLVQWETSVSRNVGLDLSFLRGKVTFTADYYHVNKSDMLLPVTLAPSSGVDTSNTTYSDIQLNAGDMYNRGVELALGYRGNISKLRYSATATFTQNINKVTRTYISESNLSGGGPLTSSSSEDDTTYVREGYPAGSFFLVQNAGVVDTEEKLTAYKEVVATAKMGDLMLIDANGDKTIDDGDRVYCGKGSADWEAGLNLNFWYKNLDFSAQLYGSYGNMVYNGAKLQSYISMRHMDQYYAWSPSNPNSTVPTMRKEAGHNNVRAFNEYYLEDGSYLRLRNIQVGYSLSRDALKKLKLRKARVYLSAQNPFTLTSYTGYDPEVGGDGIFTKGVDMASYPISAQYRVGLQLGF